MVRPLPSLRLSQSLRPRRLPSSRSSTPPSRFASTTPSGTEGAQKKAQDAFTVIQKRAGEAFAAGKKLLGPVGEKAGNMLGAYREPLVYNFSVAKELLKQVYIAERLQPPASLSTVTNAYSTLWSRVSNPAYLRGLSGRDLAKVGVYAVEAYGIFKVGEIIGRRSLVGYNVQ